MPPLVPEKVEGVYPEVRVTPFWFQVVHIRVVATPERSTELTETEEVVLGEVVEGVIVEEVALEVAVVPSMVDRAAISLVKHEGGL